MFTKQKPKTYRLHNTNLKKQAKSIFLLMGATGNKKRFSTGDKPLGGSFKTKIVGVFMFFKKLNEGFPGGAVVENLPANAGDTGSSPGLGRSHMPRSNEVRVPQLLSLHFWSLCSATREAAIVRGPRSAMKSGPRLPQLEKALAQKRRPNIAINK